GAALFRMASKALLVQRGLLQRGRAGAAVRRMAVGADHLAGADRMAGGKQGFGARALVAIGANFGLAGMRKNGIAGGMHLMATTAGQLGKFVRRAAPVVPGLAFMAAKAD